MDDAFPSAGVLSLTAPLVNICPTLAMGQAPRGMNKAESLPFERIKSNRVMSSGGRARPQGGREGWARFADAGCGRGWQAPRSV